jgi:hypothetical protein
MRSLFPSLYPDRVLAPPLPALGSPDADFASFVVVAAALTEPKGDPLARVCSDAHWRRTRPPSRWRTRSKRDGRGRQTTAEIWTLKGEGMNPRRRKNHSLWGGGGGVLLRLKYWQLLSDLGVIFVQFADSDFCLRVSVVQQGKLADPLQVHLMLYAARPNHRSIQGVGGVRRCPRLTKEWGGGWGGWVGGGCMSPISRPKGGGYPFWMYVCQDFWITPI